METQPVSPFALTELPQHFLNPLLFTLDQTMDSRTQITAHTDTRVLHQRGNDHVPFSPSSLMAMHVFALCVVVVHSRVVM